MTRKIEQALIAAIRAGEAISFGNSAVVQHDDRTEVLLHGSVIARSTNQGWQWTLAGWNTVTTRSRINALARAFDWRGVKVRKGVPVAVLGDDAYPISATEWVDARDGPGDRHANLCLHLRSRDRGEEQLMTISFTIGKAQRLKLHAILDRAVADKVIAKRERLDIEMSVSAAIAQGAKLDLDRLASFDKFNLAHDLHGIHRYIDKDDSSPTGGKLLDHFLPRCTARSA